jgi:molecular chaperone DnaK (HSP70)
MIPVGYMAKKVIKKPEWLKADGVQDVYSVTNCLSKGTFLFFACGTDTPNFTLVESNSDIFGPDAKLTQSIGIETLGGVFTPLIDNGTKVPFKISNVFSTAADNQNQISLKIYRGNKQLAKDNTFLGTYKVIGISPTPRGTPQIEITVGVKNKEINVAAIDLETGKAMNIIKVE